VAPFSSYLIQPAMSGPARESRYIRVSPLEISRKTKNKKKCRKNKIRKWNKWDANEMLMNWDAIGFFGSNRSEKSLSNKYIVCSHLKGDIYINILALAAHIYHYDNDMYINILYTTTTTRAIIIYTRCIEISTPSSDGVWKWMEWMKNFLGIFLFSGHSVAVTLVTATI